VADDAAGGGLRSGAERFGRGKGYLDAFAFLKGLQYTKIAPNLWKGRLGLKGKEHAGANQEAADAFDEPLSAMGGTYSGTDEAAS
jgi:hypothetical protein